MKTMKTIEIPAKKELVVDSITCDICGNEVKHKTRYMGYEIDTIEVKHRIGSDYPEGGSGSETTVDICGTCFDEKLIPWFRSQGGDPRIEEWDW